MLDILNDELIGFRSERNNKLIYYSGINLYIGEKYKILYWSDYMKKKTFTKSDLQTGMNVEMRDGDRYLVLLNACKGICGRNNYTNLLISAKDKSQKNLDSYKEDLTAAVTSDYDIVKIYKPKYFFQMQTLNEIEECDIIWQRDEPIEMTLDEVCEALGKNIKIVKEH